MNLRLICIFAFAAICLLIIPADAAINLDNIMGMWLFNDSSGDTAKDSSNNKMMMVKSTVLSQLMASLEKHWNLMELMIGLKFNILTL